MLYQNWPDSHISLLNKEIGFPSIITEHQMYMENFRISIGLFR